MTSYWLTKILEDRFLHHYCPICETIASFKYNKRKIYEMCSDDETECVEERIVNISENITSFCSHCGTRLLKEKTNDYQNK